MNKRRSAWIVCSPNAKFRSIFSMRGDFVANEGRSGETRLLGYTDFYKKRLSLYESPTMSTNEIMVNDVASILMSRRDRAKIDIRRRIYRKYVPGFRWLEKHLLAKIHHPQGWWRDEEPEFVFGTLTEIVREKDRLKYERR